MPAKLGYEKSSYGNMFQVLQSLRQDGIFSDIQLGTEDGTIIFGHKVVLASASPYFHAMFTNFAEKNKELVVIREIASTALLLLVEFIYSGKILITEENVKDLLPAADVLQLQEVKETCCDFLSSQLCPTNCIGINALADLHSCTKLVTSSEVYIHQHYSEVFAGDEFLSLSFEQVIKLISSDKLTVSSEEKVFESVIRWVKYELVSRRSILPQLMEHIRLPLTSKEYILENVVEERLIKSCDKSKFYVFDALNTLKSKELIPQNIRSKPRHGDKVILAVGGNQVSSTTSTEWYDPKINEWCYGKELIISRHSVGLAIMKDQLVFAVGGRNDDIDTVQSVDVLDLSSESPCWKPSVHMLVKRHFLGVGVINDNLYAVGGRNSRYGTLNSAEVFDYKTQEWRMVCSMSTTRSNFGIGVLNDLLYVVGGYYDDSLHALDTVECYNPTIDMWTPVANMCVHRSNAGVGVLDGILYAVGGENGRNILSSVEAYTPSTGVWTTISDMHLPRKNAGVVALDGLLYVVGGTGQTFKILKSVECYNPYTNTWTMVGEMKKERLRPGVVTINRPQNS